MGLPLKVAKTRILPVKSCLTVKFGVGKHLQVIQFARLAHEGRMGFARKNS
jgi:hypothetical protein